MKYPNYQNKFLNERLSRSLVYTQNSYEKHDLSFLIWHYINSNVIKPKQILHSSILADIRSNQNILTNNKMISLISKSMGSKIYNLDSYRSDLSTPTENVFNFDTLSSKGTLFNSIILDVETFLYTGISSFYENEEFFYEFSEESITHIDASHEGKIHYDNLSIENNLNQFLSLLKDEGKLFILGDGFLMNYGWHGNVVQNPYEQFGYKFFSYNTFWEKYHEFLRKLVIYPNNNMGILELRKNKPF